MDIRIIIREEIGDSIDWIQDTMSNQDIAQKIADDLKWVQDVEPNFDGINLRVGDMFRVPTVNEDGSTFSIVTIIDTGLMGDKPITYKIESGMGQLQQRNVVDNKVDFIQRIIKDKWRPLYGNRGYKLNESDELEWIKDIDDPRYSDYYILDNRSLKHSSSTFNYDDEWVLLKVIERHSNGSITYQDVERNLDDSTSWSIRCKTATIDGYWFDFLLGIGPSEPEGYKGTWKDPHWLPHHGDTSYLPKNRNYIECNNLNESDDMDWIRDSEPSIFDKLNGVTKDNDSINVNFDNDGEFYDITDENEVKYLDAYDLDLYFDYGPRIITKEELLRYLKEKRINHEWEFDNPKYEDNQDYKDYMDLYWLVEKL